MLNGRTVLIVEAEFLIALDIQRMLETLAAGEMLFARSLNEAHNHQQRWHTVDVAIVDMGDNGADTAGLLRDLTRAGITVILSTTDGAMNKGHPEFPGTPVIVKPMIEEDVLRAVVAAVASSARTSDCGS